jgi:hypothetical protein
LTLDEPALTTRIASMPLDRVPFGLNTLSSVMPARVAGIHVFYGARKNVDGRAKPGHDARCGSI